MKERLIFNSMSFLWQRSDTYNEYDAKMNISFIPVEKSPEDIFMDSADV